MLELDMTAGSRGFPSLSVQEVATTTLSTSSAITEVTHVTVKFSPAVGFPSLAIVTEGNGSAKEKLYIKPYQMYSTILSSYALPSILTTTC